MAEQLDPNHWNINRSYFLEGVSFRSHFSYYGQFQQSSRVIPVAEALAIGLIFLTGVVENFAVLVVMIQARKKPTGNNYCVANMAVGALLVLASSPMMSATRVTHTWLFGSAPCGLLTFSSVCAAVVTVWTMTLISVDRYRCTHKRLPLAPRVVLVALVGIWVIALLAALPLGFYFMDLEFPLDGDTVHICTLVWPDTDIPVSSIYTSGVVVVLFIAPLVTISVNYFRLMKTLKQSMEKFKKRPSTTSAVFPVETGPRTSTTSVSFPRSLFDQRREVRIVRLLILQVVLFFAMWCPLAIGFVLLMYDALTEALVMTSSTFVGATTVALSNACVNPYIYASVNDSCKDKLRKRLLRLCRRRTSNNVRPVGSTSTCETGTEY